MPATLQGPEPATQAAEPWRAAGAAWGHAASDWAYLFEPHARDAIEHVLRWADVGPGTALLDVACGSGYALAVADRRGATTAGLDASAELLTIAGRRVPAADLVLGSLFALPHADAGFDVVTSFNGIWGGCDDGINEMARVVRPGGHVAITFWGPGHALDLRPWFLALGRASAETRDELVDTARITDEGEAERMFAAAGLEVVDRGTTRAVLEWPDDETAWRALRSPGIVPPVLAVVDEQELRHRALTVLADHRAPDGSWALHNDLVHVLARRPAA